ncbi:MAG: sulfotransferase family protein [Jatrophihabitantaceae bacterium]
MPLPAILALWSAPRCRSTAFLRMIAERGDFTVIHEPFSQLADFGKIEVADRTVRSEPELIALLRELAAQSPVFFKDTTDFRYPSVLADRQFLSEVRHTFIVRDPAEAIASHYQLNPQLGCDEIGFARLAELFDAVAEATDEVPVVIDADELVARPAEIVRAYCERVEIEFLPQALHWRSGMRDDWKQTSRWHAETSATEGFQQARDSAPADLSGNPMLVEYLEYHLPFYRRLQQARLQPAA